MYERDRTEAEALRIAYENLIRLGWKFSAEDIGKSARSIITALDEFTPSQPSTTTSQ